MKLLFCLPITTCNKLLLIICNKNVVKITFILWKYWDKLLSSQYFYNCWGVKSLQVKVQYNKVVKALWKCCVILCVSRIFFYISQFLLSQNSMFHVQFFWVEFLYFALYFFSFSLKSQWVSAIVLLLQYLGLFNFFFFKWYLIHSTLVSYGLPLLNLLR